MDKRWLDKKLDITIEQLNEQSHEGFRASRPDQIGTENDRPGGFCYKDWDAFIAVFKEGDELWTFDSGGWNN